MDPGKERVVAPHTGSTPLDAELTVVQDGHRVGPTIPVEDYTFSAISRTGHRIVAATLHGIVLFDGHTGERLGSIPGNDLRAAFITIADQLFVGSLGGELVQYDLDTLAPIRSFGGSRGAIQETTARLTDRRLRPAAATATSACSTSPPAPASARRSPPHPTTSS
jgi:hypothetical protein